MQYEWNLVHNGCSVVTGIGICSETSKFIQIYRVLGLYEEMGLFTTDGVWTQLYRQRVSDDGSSADWVESLSYPSIYIYIYWRVAKRLNIWAMVTKNKRCSVLRCVPQLFPVTSRLICVVLRAELRPIDLRLCSGLVM